MLDVLLIAFAGYVIIRLGVTVDRVAGITERLCRSDLGEGDKSAETSSGGQ